jgi:AGCS family alanine or glycine:cation symporter
MNQGEILEFFTVLNRDYIGPLLAIILLGTGLFYTFHLRFVQRHYLQSFKMLFKGKGGKASNKDGMSSFQALTTSIASQVGTGNIVGVATAIIAGGPGAIFWLWVTSILGMSTNFAEAVLGQLYRTEKDGHAIGGPAYYIRNGLGSKTLAGIFSIFLILALGATGIMVQANSIVNASVRILPEGFNTFYIGIALAIIVGLVLMGGVTRIATFAEKVVPFMALIFMIGSFIFIGAHISDLPTVLYEIVKYAFTPWAPVGGVLGATVMASIRFGVSRGLFSNEAGLGSTPHAHAIAKVKHPYEQGLVSLIGISVDIVICTLTGLVILLSGVLTTNPTVQGVELPQMAFSSTFGVAGNYFIAASLFFFAFTTIVGWYFFAAQNVRYMFGEKFIWPYCIIVLMVILVASVVQVNLVWELADTFNFFLVVPNVIALIYLAPKVKKEVQFMRRDLRKDEQDEEDNDPVSDPEPA